ncbi:MAG: universal stress protein [Steroidobacteraceae bacterium]
MHRNILVPFNGSPAAALGLRAAVRLAKAHGGRIRLIYVLTHVPFLGLGSHARRTEAALGDLARAHRAALRWATLEMQEEGIEADSRLIEAVGGGLGETIVAEAHAWPAQLIVCGTRGGHSIARLLHESHAELIVRKSAIPVLLIPADGRSKPELARHLRPSKPAATPSLLEPAALTARGARAALTAAAAAAARDSSPPSATSSGQRG